MEEGLDIQELRDLLSLCKEFGVSGFQTGTLSLTFHRPFDPDLISIRSPHAEDSDETEVTGFKVKRKEEEPGGFRSPTLWADRGGKPYSFTE